MNLSDKRPSKRVHAIARQRAKVAMRERYPGVASRTINTVDPELWAILYSRAVFDVRKELGYVRPSPYTRKDYLGRFIPASDTVNEARGVPGRVPQAGLGKPPAPLYKSPVRCGVY